MGPEECRTFFGEPLAHLFEQGIELSHRSTSGPAARLEELGDRGSGRSEDPHCEATRGVGPVTGTAGSESLQGRGGRHPASSLEGLLVLIPSRGPHPYFRFETGPAGVGAGTESQPACRRGRGIQAAAGSPEAAWDPGSSKASAGDGPDPDHSRLAGGGKGTRTATKSPHCGATRGVGPMTGAAGDGAAGRTRWASSPPRPEGLLVLIPPGDFQNSGRPPACRWEIGAGQARRSTPRGNSRRRPGDGDGGVGGPVRSRWASPLPPQSRGPF